MAVTEQFYDCFVYDESRFTGKSGMRAHVDGLCLHTLKCWSVHADRGGGGVLLSMSNELKH